MVTGNCTLALGELPRSAEAVAIPGAGSQWTWGWPRPGGSRRNQPGTAWPAGTSTPYTDTHTHMYCIPVIVCVYTNICTHIFTCVCVNMCLYMYTCSQI